MKKNISIGVFIGGNHIACAAVDLTKRQLIQDTLFRARVENDTSAGLILILWTTYIKKVIKIVGEENIAGIGFSIPGPFDYQNGIANFVGVPKYESLKGINVREKIAQKLYLPKDVEIRFINDAIGFALGEDWSSKNAEYQSCMAIMISEGFGSAFLKNGIPVIKGESVPAKGIVYNIPYKTGIADDYFSARGLINAFAAKGRLKHDQVNSLFNLADKDNDAKQVFNEFGTNLAEFLLPIYKKFGANICVMGGEISMQFHLYEKTFNAYLHKQNSAMKVKISGMDDESFILGGASLLIEEKWNKLSPMLPELD